MAYKRLSSSLYLAASDHLKTMGYTAMPASQLGSNTWSLSDDMLLGVCMSVSYLPEGNRMRVLEEMVVARSRFVMRVTHNIRLSHVRLEFFGDLGTRLTSDREMWWCKAA